MYDWVIFNCTAKTDLLYRHIGQLPREMTGYFDGVKVKGLLTKSTFKEQQIISKLKSIPCSYLGVH